MQHLKPYSFFLNKPGGTKNLGWGFLCYFSSVFIPIVGPLVWMGYIVDCIRTLKQDPDIEDYPDFDTKRFTDYLYNGIWPFAMNLLIVVGFFFLVMLLVALGFAVGIATKEPLAGIGVFFVGYFPTLFLMALVTWPMNLHAQLRGTLEFGAAVRFSIRFFKLVGGQCLISLLIHFFIANFLILVGLLMCIVGLYGMLALITMAQQHYIVQLYRLYLAEGGEPIPDPEPDNAKKRRAEQEEDEPEPDDEQR